MNNINTQVLMCKCKCGTSSPRNPGMNSEKVLKRYVSIKKCPGLHFYGFVIGLNTSREVGHTFLIDWAIDQPPSSLPITQATVNESNLR